MTFFGPGWVELHGGKVPGKIVGVTTTVRCTKRHSEAEALAPASTSKSNATNQAGCEIEAVSKTTSQSTADSSHGSNSLALAATNCSVTMAKATEKKRKSKKRVRSSHEAICNEPRHGVATSVTIQASDAQLVAGEAAETSARPYPKGMEETKRHASCYALRALAVPNAEIAASKYKPYVARAKGPAKVQARKKGINRKARSCTGSVTRIGSSSYCARICFDSFAMRTGNCDLKTALDYLVILTSVKQKIQNQAGGGTIVERLQAALALCATDHGRNLADLKLSFRVFQHAGCFIGSPLWSPSVRSLEVFGKMRSVLEPFRAYAKHMGSRSVYWEYGPLDLEDAWIQFQSAVAKAWEMAGVDSTATLQKIRSLHEAQAQFRGASLQRWEQQNMARQDKNKHRPRHLRERNPTASLECWERRQMAFEDKNEHRPKKLRQKLQLRESSLSRQLTALRKLIARWGQMLKREAKLVEKGRQKVIRQRKAQQKKDQEERKQAEVLKQKRQREEERSRREWVRKRMQSDLTMDDILGQNSVRNHQ